MGKGGGGVEGGGGGLEVDLALIVWEGPPCSGKGGGGVEGGGGGLEVDRDRMSQFSADTFAFRISAKTCSTSASVNLLKSALLVLSVAF